MKQRVVRSISKDIFQIISDEILFRPRKSEKGPRKSGKVREFVQDLLGE